MFVCLFNVYHPGELEFVVSLKMTMRKNLEELFIPCMQEYRSATVGNLQTKKACPTQI